MRSPSFVMVVSARADRLVPYKTRGDGKVLTTSVSGTKKEAPSAWRAPRRAGCSGGGAGGYPSTPAMPMELSAVSITGDSASATPWCAIQRSASSAAMHPDPAALIACR